MRWIQQPPAAAPSYGAVGNNWQQLAQSVVDLAVFDILTIPQDKIREKIRAKILARENAIQWFERGDHVQWCVLAGYIDTDVKNFVVRAVNITQPTIDKLMIANGYY